MKNTFTAAFAVAMALVPLRASAEPTSLIFNNFLPPFEATQAVAVRDFANRIEAESNGDITVTIPDTTLAPINRQYEAVVGGIADMALLPINEIPQYVTFGNIAELPYNAPSAEAASVALWETYRKHLEAYDEFKGLVLLSAHVLPGRQFLSLKAPLDTPEAFVGKRIWVPNGPMVDTVEALGAIPSITNFPDLFENVTKGMVDALVITPDSAASGRILDAISHQTVVPGGIGSVSIAVVISAARWAELSDDQRMAIRRAAEGLPQRTGAALDAREVETAGAPSDHIVSINAPAALLAKLAPILDTQIKDWIARSRKNGLADPQAVLESYRSVLARFD
ncbi:TRAP transporter substrate-binding protein [Martelella soudanensis]|uniref:TRAP transporter substrate-binding protein n=1 Tax=Martelella sp. NC20 TaxID=2740298 RepID=UPI0015DF3D3E|nr:TRAP transporter substrate-binding protein DctP [Martelella sp. NC20]